MNNKNVALVFVLIIGSILALGCSESGEDAGTSAEAVQTGEEQAVQEEVPAQPSTEETLTETPVSDNAEKPDANFEGTEGTEKTEEASENITTLKEENSEEVPEEIPASTVEFSENNKQELASLMTENYGANEVSIAYIASKDPSSDGLLMADYYTDATPTKSELYDNIMSIITLAKETASESGIENPDVTVCAMMMDGTPLGAGTYYSSTGQTDVDVSDCPW